MAIKIYRQTPSQLEAAPPTLQYGELACDKNGRLYVGNSANVPIGALDKISYNQVGNPNLLDNTNFKNPVNQRGKSSYSLDWKYSIDRWVLLGTYSVSNHTLTFDAGNQTSRFGLDAISYMRQGIEKLDAGTYTLSAGIGDNVYSHSFVVGSTVASQAWNMGPFYFVYEKFSGVNTQWFGFGVVPGTSSPGSVALDWIKLELGEVATPYTPKAYGDELVECYRYFWISSMPVNIFKTTAGDYFRNTVYFPIAMRTVPSVTILLSNGTVSISAITIDAVKFAGVGGNDTVTSFSASADL